LQQLGEAKIFTKIDLRGAYNLLRIKKGDEWKTAFNCKYGHFEYTVMPFGLMNAPAHFQRLMHETFQEFLDTCVVVYLDDILVFSRSIEAHDRDVRRVLQRLREAKLSAKLEKCVFDSTQVEYLGYNISTKGLMMEVGKVETIVDWAPPTDLKGVQCFLGFANFYRGFIANYSEIVGPLVALTKKDAVFVWSQESEAAFQNLKKAFVSAPILVHYNPAAPCILEADASDFAMGAVLSQPGQDNQLHPVAFYSRKFTASEINYETHDKELLAIVESFRQWRHFLEGSPHQIQVFSDTQEPHTILY
jgi:hypothetical protein